jgi:hypothetical protein
MPFRGYPEKGFPCSDNGFPLPEQRLPEDGIGFDGNPAKGFPSIRNPISDSPVRLFPSEWKQCFRQSGQ